MAWRCAWSKTAWWSASRCLPRKAPEPPYLLRAQLSGIRVSVFATKDGQTQYLGHTSGKEEFKSFADFRDRAFAHGCTFNVAARLPKGASVTLGGARSFLSAGAGQADIRLVTHKDGAPFWENNRLWLTFSARGLGIDQSAQGVMSLDPSVFDIRFEGMVVYDFGDGLLRKRLFVPHFLRRRRQGMARHCLRFWRHARPGGPRQNGPHRRPRLA